MPPSLPTLKAQGHALASPERQLERLDAVELPREFADACEAAGLWPLDAHALDVLQINVGRLCNQTCRHCHVDAGPDRDEVMSRETLEACLSFLDRSEVRTVDLTGGAPELNPHFRWFVEEVRARGRHVIDRCNLTILETGAGRDLPEFFARNRVEVVCSLPHYRELSTDRQRGRGVYERSIAALRALNAVGYGDGESGLKLRIVTNPVGAFLPPSQGSLEAEWKRELERLHGIVFDSLFTITNMPIARYLEWLELSENLDDYLQRLVEAFNPVAAAGVMCRSMISVAHDGTLHDCDFNQMLELGLAPGAPATIFDAEPARLIGRAIVAHRHCFGCTAGGGSSCGGQLD
ncbi:MAG: arsenosugar biosynthesis radical SAM protein ArsS [Deltaproteobacteria bacterium]|nr:arsenosugar biosynthesis radical SAM protein ArsS [Deltaproteobacteria bacterium]